MAAIPPCIVYHCFNPWEESATSRGIMHHQPRGGAHEKQKLMDGFRSAQDVAGRRRRGLHDGVQFDGRILEMAGPGVGPFRLDGGDLRLGAVVGIGDCGQVEVDQLAHRQAAGSQPQLTVAGHVDVLRRQVEVRAARQDALGSQIRHDLIDFRLAAHIDAAGWLIQDEDLRADAQPTGENHFLLVASA